MREADLFVLPSLAENLPGGADRGHGQRPARRWPPVWAGCPRCWTSAPACWCEPGDAEALAAAIRHGRWSADFDPPAMAARGPRALRLRRRAPSAGPRSTRSWQQARQQLAATRRAPRPPSRAPAAPRARRGVGVALRPAQRQRGRAARGPARLVPALGHQLGRAARAPAATPRCTPGARRADQRRAGGQRLHLGQAPVLDPRGAEEHAARRRSGPASARAPRPPATPPPAARAAPLRRSQAGPRRGPRRRCPARRPPGRSSRPGRAEHVQAALVGVAGVGQHRRGASAAGAAVATGGDTSTSDVGARRACQRPARSRAAAGPPAASTARSRRRCHAPPGPGPVHGGEAVEADRRAGPCGLQQRGGDARVDDRAGADAAGGAAGRQRLDHVGGGHRAPQRRRPPQRHRRSTSHVAPGLAHMAGQRVVGPAPPERGARRDQRDVGRSGHGESVGSGAVASDPRPVALITGTISPYRREPFRLLGQDAGRGGPGLRGHRAPDRRADHPQRDPAGGRPAWWPAAATGP